MAFQIHQTIEVQSGNTLIFVMDQDLPLGYFSFPKSHLQCDFLPLMNKKAKILEGFRLLQ